MANTYLTRTFGSPTNNYKWTFSAWIKKCGVSEDQYIFQTYPSGEGYMRIYFEAGDTLKFDGEDTSQSNAFGYRTTRLFRDTNAWYHLVVKWDVTQGTAGDRAKIYINGVQETSFSSSTNPAQNTTYPINRNKLHNLGRHSSATDTYFNGLMSHVHFTDGYSYDASTFGLTDSTTGEWKINTAPSITMGTNGFTILKDGNTITDQSSNSNNFTLANGTLTKTQDNPSNVFATLNPLFIGNGQAATFSNGNTTGQSPTSQGIGGTSTLAANSGKFYAEFKYAADTSGSNNEGAIGVCDTYFLSSNSSLGGSSSPGYQEYSVANWGLRNAGNTFYSSSGSKYTNSSQHGNWTLNDIIGVALDIDNNRVYFSKNGGWWNGTSSWGGASPTNYITLDSTGFEGNYHFAVGDSSSGNSVTWNSNFGNGYFGTTAVATNSGNGYAGAEGSSIFNYQPPTGYSALSTKGLNL